MSAFVQNIIVLSIVVACAAYVVWQFVRTMRLSQGKLGACCAKGCEPAKPVEATGTREQFIASDSLVRAVKSRR
jgi:hypothetical protein